MRIYLAGKISPNCWRHQYVEGLEEASVDRLILPKAIRGRHDYTGPFFINCGGHQLGHGDNTHGVNGIAYRHPQHSSQKEVAFERCVKGIDLCEVMIVKLSIDSYGTLVEIGLAKAMGKHVFVIGEVPDDCWFARGCCVGGIDFQHEQETIESILDWCDIEHYKREFMSRCESPAETAFAEAIWNDNDERPENPESQFELGEYRLDFAFPISKVCVEIDGIEFHGNQEAFVKDRKRTRWLESQGWYVMRFAAKEVLPPTPYYSVANEVWAVVSKRLESAHA